MQKNDVLILQAQAFGSQAEGLCKFDGRVVFVPGVLPGETAEVLIVKVQKNHAFGKLLKVIEPSPHRTIPPCPYYPQCGGCSCQHMDYDTELKFKQAHVRDVLQRIGGLDVNVPAVIGMQEPWHYRNKTSQPVVKQDGLAVAGFYMRRSHQVIATQRCLIAQEKSDLAANIVIGWMREKEIEPYNELLHQGLVRNIMTRVNHSGESMVTLIVNAQSIPEKDSLISALKDKLPGFVSLCLSPNTEKGNTILGQNYHVLWGSDGLKDSLCGFEFTLSPLSFFQINQSQAEILYQKALELSAVKPTDLVIDLYCGAGTITSLFAKHCKEVIGIEIVPQAIIDAEKNAQDNGISNVNFLLGSAEELMPALAQKDYFPDIIVLDPPRKGAAPEVLSAIADANPKKIVYISCDPATQARDTRILVELGYKVCACQPVDMFCRTPDVENILLFERDEI